MSIPPGPQGQHPQPARPAPPISPDRVRNWKFSRTALGRRGYSADEVRLFLARVAEELAAADAEKAALRAEIRRLRNYFRDHKLDVDGQHPAPQSGHDDSGPTLAAINIMSQAQQAADAQVAQAEEYSRRLVHQAREQYEDILREAADQAAVAADKAGAAYAASSNWEGPEREALERRIAWLRTFAEVTEVQLRSVLEALTREVDKLGDLPSAAPASQVPTAPSNVPRATHGT